MWIPAYTNLLNEDRKMLTLTTVFKNLSDETRLRSMLLLQSEGELCVCELIEALDEPQTKISRHLSLLKSSGLLADRRQGQWIYYRINDGLPHWVHELLELSKEANESQLQQDMSRLTIMTDEPRLVSNR